MSTEGLIMMLVTEIFVTIITVYFFLKILKTPSKQEPDSFSENDPE